MTFDEFEAAFYRSLNEAHKHMDLEDLPDDATDDERYDAYEERYHCGTCVTNHVLQIVMVPIMEYIDSLLPATEPSP